MNAAWPRAMTNTPTACITAALLASMVSLAILAKKPQSPQRTNVAIDRTSHAGICGPPHLALTRPSRR
jgi:hypothetical protein